MIANAWDGIYIRDSVDLFKSEPEMLVCLLLGERDNAIHSNLTSHQHPCALITIQLPSNQINVSEDHLIIANKLGCPSVSKASRKPI